ncbi:hypothetical protein AXG93_4123s1290 [Marchantia polymorpha subsp. ruderalis]|uniref:Uncharacterized protein n=1 Tax=Marchantia polymorpha subsp. ruderalis TaxID=1480154 RepID=A0A176WKG3_MARPO|nr:hypothetical protein AXG93_4123s1290 [Marchantia polymorpha subsp. ruderalis]
MAMPRGIMVLRDRRDRILIQQQQQQGLGLPPGPGCPPLHPGLFNRPPNRFDGEDDEFARILPLPGAVVWDGLQQLQHQHQHQQQQQALAGVMLRRRMNAQHMQQQQQQQHLIPAAMLHAQQRACQVQVQVQVQPQEWDGGPSHPAQVVHEAMRRRTAGLVVDGDFLAGLRHREEMSDLRNAEQQQQQHLKLASRVSHEKMMAESEYLRIASRASHEKLIERDHQLKNAYRASHEKIIAEKEYLKKVVVRAPLPQPQPQPPPLPLPLPLAHSSLGEKPLEGEPRPSPVADMARPFRNPPLQALDPHFACWDEGAMRDSDLVIRYGARQSAAARAQEGAADASIPPGFQSVIMSCKRPRDEDGEFDRPQRLQHQRPRRPPDPDLQPQPQPQQQPQALYGSSRFVDEDHEEGQVTPPQSSIPAYHRAEPLGPPGFYRPELEAASRRLTPTPAPAPPSQEPPSAIAPPFQDGRDPLLLRPRSSASRPPGASRASSAGGGAGGGSDAGLPSRPCSSRGVGVGAGAAGARILVVESPPPSRRALPPPPPPPLPLPPAPLSSRLLSSLDSPTRRPPSPTSSSRPGRDLESFLGAGPFKGEILVPKRERKDDRSIDQQQQQQQQQRLSFGGVEANASDASHEEASPPPPPPPSSRRGATAGEGC